MTASAGNGPEIAAIEPVPDLAVHQEDSAGLNRRQPCSRQIAPSRSRGKRLAEDDVIETVTVAPLSANAAVPAGRDMLQEREIPQPM